MIRGYLAKRRFTREHRWTQAHLSAYLDDDLRPHEHARASAHIGRCPECERVLRTLRRTVEALMALRGASADSVAPSVIERLRSEP